MSFRIVAPGLLTLAIASASSAQLPQFSAPGMSREYQELMVAMTAAQAKAIRPGDESMACPAIEKELLTSMNDPAIQAYAEKAGALAQKQALAAAKVQSTAAPQAAAALAAALGGGIAVPGATPGMPAMTAQQIQGAQNPVAQMKLLLPILPQMMRSQQLVALAIGRQCAWIAGANPFGPFVPQR